MAGSKRGGFVKRMRRLSVNILGGDDEDDAAPSHKVSADDDAENLRSVMGGVDKSASPVLAGPDEGAGLVRCMVLAASSAPCRCNLLTLRRTGVTHTQEKNRPYAPSFGQYCRETERQA